MHLRQVMNYSFEDGSYREICVKLQRWIPAKEDDSESVKINGGYWGDLPVTITGGYSLDPAPEGE